MKRRLKITVTHTRRTITSYRSPVLHVVCPNCASTAETRTVAGSDEMMETRLSADAAPAPSKITIFRAPLVRANRTPERLAAAVADTVYHEIAHHFGISDERLHELKRGET